jgi:hypothetical protein
MPSATGQISNAHRLLLKWRSFSAELNGSGRVEFKVVGASETDAAIVSCGKRACFTFCATVNRSQRRAAGSST